MKNTGTHRKSSCSPVIMKVRTRIMKMNISPNGTFRFGAIRLKEKAITTSKMTERKSIQNSAEDVWH